VALTVALGAVAALGTGWQAQAQAGEKTMLVEPPAPLLPATLGKLKRVAEGEVGDGLGELDAAGLSAQEKAVLAEDGLKRFAKSDYAPEGSARAEATVTAYRFADASGAISAYDYLVKPGMHAERLGDASVASGDELLMRSGVTVVRASFRQGHEAMVALTKELIEHLPKVSGPASMAPLLPGLLPRKGFEPDSVKYALGPEGYAAMGGTLPVQAVGFDKSAEAVTAKDRDGGTLTLLLYPTPEIAGEHLRELQAEVKQEGAAEGTVMMRREGPLVAVTTGAWKPAAARAMVESVHLNSEVSFDKPLPLEFHTEMKKTYSLLETIFIFCCISALAMLVLGLFFGGGRALIRVLQGKPAATEPEFLHIDLSGRPARRLGDGDS